MNYRTIVTISRQFFTACYFQPPENLGMAKYSGVYFNYTAIEGELVNYTCPIKFETYSDKQQATFNCSEGSWIDLDSDENMKSHLEIDLCRPGSAISLIQYSS